MKIGVDVRCVTEGRRTGVEEYILNMLKHLFQLDRRNEYVLFSNAFSRTEFSFKEWENYPNVKVKNFRLPNKLLNFCFRCLGWPKIDKMLGGVDILFLPNIAFAAWSKNSKVFLTVHDLSFVRFSQTFSLKRRLWHFFVSPRRLCDLADKIITVSYSTSEDLKKLFGVEKNKIEVIYSGVADKFKPVSRSEEKLFEIRKKYNLPEDFILCLSTLEPRKNILTLIEAFEFLKKSDQPEVKKIKLVMAGSPGWKDEKIYRRWKNLVCREEIFFPGFIAEEDKLWVYNLAKIFVYVSLFEGFGFPPLEAMSCGLPVITSNNSSLPEITGSAGLMVDPDRPEELEKALFFLIVNSNIRSEMAQRGLERAKLFDWEKAARCLLNLFEKELRKEA